MYKNRNFSKKISTLEEQTVLILEGIVLRLCMDLNNEINSTRGIIILKCFNIIRTFVEQNNYIMNFFSHIDKTVSPIYEYLKLDNFEFVEDVFAIILCQINKKQSVPNSMVKLLPIFREILERRKGILGTLFQILNGFLIFGENVFLNNSNNIELVKTTSIISFSN